MRNETATDSVRNLGWLLVAIEEASESLSPSAEDSSSTDSHSDARPPKAAIVACEEYIAGSQFLPTGIMG